MHAGKIESARSPGVAGAKRSDGLARGALATGALSERENNELLMVDDLAVRYDGQRAGTRAVRGATFHVDAGEALGVAGESGSGKSTAALAIIGLLGPTAEVTGSIRLRGRELVGLSDRELRRVRGAQIAMVFQEVITALNPVVRVGDQLIRAVRAHSNLSKADARDRVARALRDMKLSDVDRVVRSYPNELSGGMAQRVMIAMALSCGARLLIADEPTTALDVSVQAEILELLRDVIGRRGLGLIMISHDLGVLDEVCNRLAIMYEGEVVESGNISDVLQAPRHPYTAGLLQCLPKLGSGRTTFTEIGTPESVVTDIGCLFRGRCPLEVAHCAVHPDLIIVDTVDHAARCWLHRAMAADGLSIWTERNRRLRREE